MPVRHTLAEARVSVNVFTDELNSPNGSRLLNIAALALAGRFEQASEARG